MESVSVSDAAAMLQVADNILIVTHTRPDGDAAGSSCGLCLGLRTLGKTAYLAENPPSMRRYSKYMDPYFSPTDFRQDFVAAVDIPSRGQFPSGWETLASSVDLAIDHHGTNSGYGKATLLEPDSAATGEMIYKLLTEMGASLTPIISEALYVALATDTNGFRTPSTTGRTLAIAGTLHDLGFNATALIRRLFETKSVARLRLEAALFDSMHFPAKGVCVMVLPLDTIYSCGAIEDDMDKISTLTMVPEGVWAGILLRQLADGSWKISLRTDGSVYAGSVCQVLGGGGHQDAAGAVISGRPEDIEDDILEALKQEAKTSK